jgi:phosphopantothenoylcysteine decarboxylase/phosphopantothenate--cysteine ligase
MHRAVKEEFVKCHCLVMAAAPADYRPSELAAGKIKRSSGGYMLTLEPTVDILKDIAGMKRKGQVVVGFALETDDGLISARRKLKQKSLDLILLNRVGPSTGFDHDANQVTLIRPEGEPEVWPLQEKSAIALKLLDMIAGLL